MKSVGGEGPGQIYFTATHWRLYDGVRASLTAREPDTSGRVFVITGPPGIGKTTLMRRALEDPPAEAQILTTHHTSLDFAEFLALIYRKLGVAGAEEGGEIDLETALSGLERRLAEAHEAGERIVMAIDEAQALSVETLEHLALMARPRLGCAPLWLVLAGQDALQERLADPDAAQLKELVVENARLAPFTDDEARAFIRQRFHPIREGAGRAEDNTLHAARIAARASIRPDNGPISEFAIQRIIAYARGTPRLIGLICNHAMLFAVEDPDREVTETMIEEAAHNLLLTERAPSEIDRAETDADDDSDDTAPGEEDVEDAIMDEDAENMTNQSHQSGGGLSRRGASDIAHDYAARGEGVDVSDAIRRMRNIAAKARTEPTEDASKIVAKLRAARVAEESETEEESSGGLAGLAGRLGGRFGGGAKAADASSDKPAPDAGPEPTPDPAVPPGPTVETPDARAGASVVASLRDRSVKAVSGLAGVTSMFSRKRKQADAPAAAPDTPPTPEPTPSAAEPAATSTYEAELAALREEAAIEEAAAEAPEFAPAAIKRYRKSASGGRRPAGRPAHALRRPLPVKSGPKVFGLRITPASVITCLLFAFGGWMAMNPQSVIGAGRSLLAPTNGPASAVAAANQADDGPYVVAIADPKALITEMRARRTSAPGGAGREVLFPAGGVRMSLEDDGRLFTPEPVAMTPAPTPTPSAPAAPAAPEPGSETLDDAALGGLFGGAGETEVAAIAGATMADAAPATPEQPLDLGGLFGGSGADVSAEAPVEPTAADAPAAPAMETAPASATPAIDPAMAAQIAAHLAEAKARRAKDRLTLPAGVSAYDSYREVLALDPDNAEAQAGLEELKSTYLRWARAAIRRGDQAKARRQYERALVIDPNDAAARQGVAALGGAG